MNNRVHKRFGNFDISLVARFCSLINSAGKKTPSLHVMRDKNLRVDFDFQIQSKECFEYYLNENGIYKAAFRKRYNSLKDICYVISKENTIVTFYLINRTDNHKKLKRNLYI